MCNNCEPFQCFTFLKLVSLLAAFSGLITNSVCFVVELIFQDTHKDGLVPVFYTNSIKTTQRTKHPTRPRLPVWRSRLGVGGFLGHQNRPALLNVAFSCCFAICKSAAVIARPCGLFSFEWRTKPGAFKSTRLSIPPKYVRQLISLLLTDKHADGISTVPFPSTSGWK